MLGITLKETRVYREIKEEGREEGELRERSLILRLLQRRVGELPQQVRERVENLCLEQLENLGEALLDFTSVADLQAWLEARQIQPLTLTQKCCFKHPNIVGRLYI